MDEQLIPSTGGSSVSTEGKYDREYRRSLRWDPVKGDFDLDGTGAITYADGYEGYRQWCLKISQTERFGCLAYPDEIGVEMDQAIALDDHAAVESMVRRTVTEALLTNPRTVAVTDFSFEWDGETVYGSCVVHAREMDDFTLRF